MIRMLVCDKCYKFLKTIYTNKQLKKINIIPPDQKENIHCLSNYHNKLVDSFKS